MERSTMQGLKERVGNVFGSAQDVEADDRLDALALEEWLLAATEDEIQEWHDFVNREEFSSYPSRDDPRGFVTW